MKKTIFYIIAALRITLGSLASAQPPIPTPGDLNRLWIHEDHILSKLGLKHEQMIKIENLRKTLMEGIAPLRTLRYEKFTELKLLLSDPTHDKEKVIAKMKEVHNLIWQMVEKEMYYWLAFKDIFTLEQYSSFINSIGSGGF